MKTIKNIYVIFLRELKSYITSPIFYVVLGLFFFLIGLIFLFQLQTFNEICKRAGSELVAYKIAALDVNFHVLSNFLKNIGFLCLFFFPILTMRLISDEKKNKTIELLMTSPISTYEIVIGKFFAITVLWILMLLFLLIYPFIVAQLPFITVDWNCYISGLLGLFFYGLLGIAMGLLASTFTDNQLVSAVLGFSLIAAFYFLIFIAVQSDTPFGRVLYSASIWAHFGDFLSGVIDTNNIIYFVTASAFTLFVAERSLESQRWR